MRWLAQINEAASQAGELRDTVAIDGGLPMQLLGLVGQEQIGAVFKWMAVLGLIMYAVFAAVVIKQVGIMTNSVETGANGLIKLAAWLHLVGAILLVAMAIVIL